MSFHSQQDTVHKPFDTDWVVADETARLALTVTSDDLYKLCYQQDTQKIYLLTAVTPTWIEIGGSGSGYPFSIISVDLTSPHADYDNLTDAMAAALAGDVIVLGPGSFTITAKLTVTSGVGIIGHGIDITSITCTSDLSGDEMIEVEAASFLQNLSVSWSGNTTSATGILLSGADSFLDNVDAVFAFVGGGSQDYIGTHVSANGKIKQTNSAVTVSSGSDTAIALYLNATTGAAQATSGNFTATGSTENYDIYMESGGGYNLVNGCIAQNGSVSVLDNIDGHVSGWYLNGTSGEPFYFIEESFAITILDETTALTTGTKFTFKVPYQLHLTEVRLFATTAPTGQALIVDIEHPSSISIFSTRPQIDAGENDSRDSGTTQAFSSPNLVDTDNVLIVIDQIGSGTAGAGLKVTFIGYRSP